MKKLLLVSILAWLVPLVSFSAEKEFVANFDVAVYPNTDFSGESLAFFEAGARFKVIEVDPEHAWVKVKLSRGRTGYADYTSVEWIQNPEQWDEEPEQKHLGRRGEKMSPTMRMVCGVWLSVIFLLSGVAVLFFRQFPLSATDKKKWMILIGVISTMGFSYVVIIGSVYNFWEMSIWMFYDVGFLRAVLHGVLLFGFSALLLLIAKEIPFWRLVNQITPQLRRLFKGKLPEDDSTEPRFTPAEVVVYLMFWTFLIVVLLRLLGVVMMIVMVCAMVAFFGWLFQQSGGFSAAFGTDAVSLHRNSSGDLEDNVGNLFDQMPNGKVKKR